jgi:hypothetical protein
MTTSVPRELDIVCVKYNIKPVFFTTTLLTQLYVKFGILLTCGKYFFCLIAWTGYPSQAPGFTPGFFGGSVLLIFLVFCVVLLCVFTFWVQCCYVGYDFRIQTIFGSSLLPIVCRMVHVIVTLFVFVCL